MGGGSRTRRAFQEINQQRACRFGLLLLYPVAGAVEQMHTYHSGAGPLLHYLESTGPLIDAPIALAGDEDGGHVERAAGEQFEFGFEVSAGARAIPVQPALEAVALVFTGID